MENKTNKPESFFKNNHREGFTWKDSLFIHGLLTLVIFLIGEVSKTVLYILIPVLLAGEDPDFVQTFRFYAPFIFYWIIVILFCLIVKSNRPILKSFWRGLKGNTVPKYLLGLLMGFGLNALCIGAAVLHQDIRIYWPGISAGAILPFMILAVAVAVQCGAEEILYRGYYFQRLRKGYKSPAFAVLINPVIFLLGHVFNPGATVLALLNVYLIGVAMSLMLFYFDSFWLVLAFHATWNFSQDVFFGLPNSGIIHNYSIGKLDTSAVRDSFFYSANFGVEGTGFTTVMILALILVLFLIIRKSKKTPTDIWAERKDNYYEENRGTVQ